MISPHHPNAVYWLLTAIVLAKTHRPKEFEEAMRAFWDTLKQQR